MTAATTPETLPSGRLMAFDPPPNWDVKPLGYLFDSVGGATPSKDEQAYWEGSIPWVSPKDMKVAVITDSEDHISERALKETRLALLPPSVVLIVVRGMILAHTIPVAMTSREVTINQDMKGLFAKRGLLPEYLSHLLRAISPVLFATVEESGHGTRCLRLDLWRNILVGLPSDEEQRSIVRYIDRKTAQIDALIARKQRQIELLGEKRQALISQAVTKGLDPSAPMRPSGIPWLGEVPEHWEVTRIKWVARMESGHTPDKKVEAYWTNCNIPWVSLNDSKQLRVTDYISETAHYVNELGIANSSARLLPPGAVVFSRDATIGLCAITTREMAVSQHFIAWLCGPRVRPEYLLRVFQCMTEELDRLTFGATVKTIGMPDVRELVMPLPPIGEQDAIVQAVRGYRTSGNDLGRKVQRQVDLLREYRQTLISAAVTGKVQVPTELAK